MDLKKYLKKHGVVLTHAEIAEILGVSTISVSRMNTVTTERKYRTFTIDEVIKICRKTGIPAIQALVDLEIFTKREVLEVAGGLIQELLNDASQL
jgi:predicted XRE-type DNA-binding protein